MQATSLTLPPSVSATEAQSSNTSARMTVNQAFPMHWKPIFRDSRPRNPSWLSSYDITQPKETTSPILSIVNQSTFAIEKNKPATVPDKFTRYENYIQELYNKYEFEQAQKKAIDIVTHISSEPEANNLVLYLNTVIFLRHIMEDMTSCLQLPADKL